MNNKSIIIIILTIILLAVIASGCYFLFFNNNETQTLTFEKFTIEVPKSIEFQTSVNNIHMVNSSEGYFVGELNTQDLSQGIGAGMFKGILDKNSAIEDTKGFNVENNSALHIYKLNHASGNTKYIATYNPTGVFIIVGAPDLDSLQSMVNSIIITNKTIDINNTTSNQNQEVKHVSQSPTKSNESGELSEEELMYAYFYGYSDGYNDGHYSDYDYNYDYDSGSSESGSTSSDWSESGESSYSILASLLNYI
ncbi:hypothetical protein [uncultured Methanobrevibacter sp.]|uniref:hypothetical protein n=1 Tax=uncultured Methanobrevibacter sp. TaxID=253161 RepID=UPI00260EDE6E|nr:hypothetical protein [uncultured Methanobrevibacter sp.]